MKSLLIIAALLTLNSCNTLIGLGRDTQEGYRWTKQKIQGDKVVEEAGAPVY